MLGAERSLLRGRPLQPYVAVSHRRTFADSLKKALADHARVSCELKLAAGERRPLFVLVEFSAATDGETCRLSLLDVTDRKRAEAERAAAEERFTKAFRLAPYALSLTRFADNTLVEVNDRFCLISGYTREEAIGRTPVDLGLWADPADRAEVFAELGRTGRVVGKECRLRDKSGRLISALLSAEVIEIGRERCLLANVNDISDRKQVEEKLQQTLAELKRSNEDLEQYAYVASHDLQEPLRMVANYVQLLRQRYEGKLDERADKYIGYAADGAVRMQALIHDLLIYSRVGRRELAIKQVRLSRAVQQAMDNLAGVIGQSGARIEAGPLPTVAGDEAQFVQLFQNLFDNAIKFHGATLPVVSVSCCDAGDKWDCSVGDNGIGIDPKHHERIFRLFQRLHTHEEYPGSGIGLAVCKKIVERHGGTIHVEPAEGGGSIFRFTLPKQGKVEVEIGVKPGEPEVKKQESRTKE
jgi:PAS domain S-box-containing protein